MGDWINAAEAAQRLGVKQATHPAASPYDLYRPRPGDPSEPGGPEAAPRASRPGASARPAAGRGHRA
jgi:hypothetical protein